MKTVTLNMYRFLRVQLAEYVIHIPVAASQEFVNTYSTRRISILTHTMMLCASPVRPLPTGDSGHGPQRHPASTATPHYHTPSNLPRGFHIIYLRGNPG